MKGRGEKGVTLIEIAVVLAIVGIMALFMAPAIGEWLENYRLRQAAREMSSDLQFAKIKAISMGRNCTVVFQQVVSGTQYAYVIFPDYDSDLELDSGNETNEIIKMAVFKRNIAYDTSEGGGDGVDFPDVGSYPAVAFNPRGLPRDSSGPLGNPGSIFIQNTKNNKKRQVTLSPAGGISINDY